MKHKTNFENEQAYVDKYMKYHVVSSNKYRKKVAVKDQVGKELEYVDNYIKYHVVNEKKYRKKISTRDQVENALKRVENQMGAYLARIIVWPQFHRSYPPKPRRNRR